MKRKILFFNQCREIGGTDTFLVNLLRSWPDPNDELFIESNADHKGRHFYQGISLKYGDVRFPTLQVIFERIEQMNAPKLLKRLLRLLTFIAKPLIFAASIIYFYVRLLPQSPDVVFSSNGGYPAGELCLAIVIAAKLAGVKKVFLIVHSAAQEPKFPFVLWERLVVDRLVLISCSEIISVSKSCAQQVERARKFDRKLKVIYNGIPQDKNSVPTLEAKRKVLKLSPDNKVIGAIGDYEELKGHAYLVQAFDRVKAKFPEAKLILIGSSASPYFLELKRIIERSPNRGNITLTGYLSEARNYVECFDLLVQPSIAYEGFGLALLEAMLYKKPVIGTSVGGIPEVIGDAGYIVEPKNSKQLAEKIIDLLEDPGKAGRLGEKGFQRLRENFSANVMAGKYYAICGEKK